MTITLHLVLIHKHIFQKDLKCLAVFEYNAGSSNFCSCDAQRQGQNLVAEVECLRTTQILHSYTALTLHPISLHLLEYTKYYKEWTCQILTLSMINLGILTISSFNSLIQIYILKVYLVNYVQKQPGNRENSIDQSLKRIQESFSPVHVLHQTSL